MNQQFQQQFLPQQLRKAVEHYYYNLSDIIRRGFSSVVYKGVNDITGETVAIKVVEQRSLQEQVQTMVLTNEIETLKKLKSENILKLHDVFYTINNTYIITEYCDQGDLGTHIRQNGALKEEQAIKVLKHVVNGLKELQKHGIAHRDLKPDNILLKDGVPKIADFGFAKSLEQISQNAGKEFKVGNLLYMSPETLTKNEYSVKTDIWSLGVMFYELVFGSLPWTANTEQELMHQIFNFQVTFPVQQPVTQELKNLILRCITVDPNNRMSLVDIINHPLIGMEKNQQQSMLNERLRVIKHPQLLRQISSPALFHPNQKISNVQDQVVLNDYKGSKDPVYAFLVNRMNKINDIRRRLRQKTQELFPQNSNMLTAPDQGEHMNFLIKSIKGKRGIEIGTFTGYSALCMAQALPKDGKLICFDVNEQFTSIGKPFWKEAGLDDIIDLRIMLANDGLDLLLQDPNNIESFDFGFIDADKENQTTYYEKLKRLIRPGGIIIVDNTLWGGSVADPNKRMHGETKAIWDTVQHILNDDTVDAHSIKLSDGITFALKK